VIWVSRPRQTDSTRSVEIRECRAGFVCNRPLPPPPPTSGPVSLNVELRHRCSEFIYRMWQQGIDQTILWQSWTIVNLNNVFYIIPYFFKHKTLVMGLKTCFKIFYIYWITFKLIWMLNSNSKKGVVHI